jgi:type II secretory pathway pseudopilin PulG
MMRAATLVVAAALAAAACGQSEAQRRAEEASKQAEAAAKAVEKAAKDAAQASAPAAEDAAKGFAAMARGLEAMVAGGGDGKTVNPVSFRDLIALFPDIDGWEKGKPTGERLTAPFAYSTAEVTYSRETSRMTLKMADSGFNQLFFAPFAMAMQMGYEKETTEGYEKSTQIRGQPGFEKWNSDRKDGEITMVVGKRFLVTVDADRIDDIQVLHDVVGRLDLDKLAALK